MRYEVRDELKRERQGELVNKNLFPLSVVMSDIYGIHVYFYIFIVTSLKYIFKSVVMSNFGGINFFFSKYLS